MANDPTRPRGIPYDGLALDTHRFMLAVEPAQLDSLFLNPRVAENRRALDVMPTMRRFAERRELIQRLLATQRKKRLNVESYKAYIRQVVKDERMGSFPPIEGYTPEMLEVVDDTLYVPHGERLVSFDGDTQLTAHFDLLGDEVFEYPAEYLLPVIVHFNHPLEWAAQQLHDRNAFGVKLSSSEALERDIYDEITGFTRALIDVSGLRVNRRKRQLGSRDPEQVTLSALRQAVATTVAGRPAIQHGTKPYSLPVGVDLDEIRDTVVAVWDPLLEQIDEELTPERRRSSVLSAPSVLAGLGVVCHHAMPDSIRGEKVAPWDSEAVLETVDDVNWSRSVDTKKGTIYPWLNIAGKLNDTTGRFSVGGAKEYAYACADALENPHSERGRQIRSVR